MKTSVKFQKNRNKTVGGVAHTRYILLKDGRKDGRKDERTEGRRTEGRTDGKPNVPPLFFEKAGDKKQLNLGGPSNRQPFSKLPA